MPRRAGSRMPPRRRRRRRPWPWPPMVRPLRALPPPPDRGAPPTSSRRCRRAARRADLRRRRDGPWSPLWRMRGRRTGPRPSSAPLMRATGRPGSWRPGGRPWRSRQERTEARRPGLRERVRPGTGSADRDSADREWSWSSGRLGGRIAEWGAGGRSGSRSLKSFES